MPYKNNDYKNFIRSARWQRLRAYHLKRHPLCARCKAKGKVTLATEVHHIIKCHDDPALQMDAAQPREPMRTMPRPNHQRRPPWLQLCDRQRRLCHRPKASKQ